MFVRPQSTRGPIRRREEEMTDSAVISLSGRLDRLEQEVKCWRRAGIAAFAILSLIGVTAAIPAKIPDELRARRFIVVDDGRVRAELGGLTKDIGTGLVLYDARGSIRLRAIVFPTARQNSISSSPSMRIEEETHLQLFDPETYGRILLHLDNEAGPELRLSGVRGPNVALGVEPKAGPYLQLYTADGHILWRAP
jgi:hypothetical protein